jgi:hypothetical protein
MPKELLASIFLIEVIIFGQLKYFLFSLWLILIPISFNIFIKLFISFGVRNVSILKIKFLNIEGINPSYNEENEIIGYEKYSYIVNPEYEDLINPEEEMLTLLALQRIQSYGQQLKKDILFSTIYVTFITSFIYSIGGITRLLIIFG